MRLTARRLNRTTLLRQLLLERAPLTVPDAVRRIVAMQAQSPASPYIALWSRVAGFDPARLDAAYADYQVVRASLMRITLHAVAIEDYPAFQHAAVRYLRAARLNDARYTSTGLSTDDADAIVPEVLSHCVTPRTNADMESWLAGRFGRPVPRLWWALRHFAPLVHAPTGGPWSYRDQAAYVTAPVLPPTGEPGPSDRQLVRRYLEAFGPATAADIAQFTFFRRPIMAAVLEDLAGELEAHEGPSGTLYDLPGAPLADEDAEAPPRLLGMWDLTMLAYADRDRVLPADYRSSVIRRNGDVLPTLLVDGRVAGVWRPAEDRIEATAFHELPAKAWHGLAAEAESLVELLSNRDPGVYRRHLHWWRDVQGPQTRLLPG